MGFHITDSGDVRTCNATVRKCKYGDGDHFEDRAVARRVAEERLEAEFADLESFVSTLGPQTVEAEHDNSVREIYADLDFSSPDSSVVRAALIEAGRRHESTLVDKLGFDPYSQDISKEQFLQVAEANRGLIASLDRGSLPESEHTLEGTGPMRKLYHESISVLPSAAHRTVAPVHITLSKGGNPSTPGANIYGNHSYYDDYTVATEDNNYEVGTFYKSDTYNLVEYTGMVVNCKGDERDDVFWVGEKPSDRSSYRMKKVADSVTVLNAAGEPTQLDRPVYSLKSQAWREGTKIRVHNTNIEDVAARSTMMHENIHTVVQFDEAARKQQHDLFMSIAKESPKAYSLGLSQAYYSDFPDPYMGSLNGNELVTVASEAFFYPEQLDRQFLYGSEERPNRDLIRQWITGFWVAQAMRS